MASQADAIELIRSGKNVFLSGPGGVGKSWVIRQVTEKGTLLAAPTGAAALNIGGVTCHRLFGLPFGIPTIEDYNKVSTKVKKLLGSKHLKRIIIDEISLTSAMTLDFINHRLQQCRGNKLEFGGVQLVVVGDMHQLPPVITQREAPLYFQQYESPFAFTADSWNFTTVELTKNYRQTDDTHVRVLHSFRKKDRWVQRAITWLEETCQPYCASKDVLTLCAYKADAERINRFKYSQLQGKEHTFKGITNNQKGWSKDIAVPEVVSLKVGTKVVCRANCPEGQYVNGSRGEVKSILPNSVIVTLDSGGDVEVVMFTWEQFTYSSTVKGLSKTVEFMYQQIPLQLGYASTIHSAQGLTLGEYALDLGRSAFSAGLCYVGLSRAKDLSQISFVRPITLSDVIVDQSVLDFYGGYLE